MPTVLRIGGFRFHFYSDEGDEPPHIHCRFEGKECKFWLNPVQLASNRGIAAPRLREIERMVYEFREQFEHQYHEHRNRQR